MDNMDHMIWITTPHLFWPFLSEHTVLIMFRIQPVQSRARLQIITEILREPSSY